MTNIIVQPDADVHQVTEQNEQTIRADERERLQVETICHQQLTMTEQLADLSVSLMKMSQSLDAIETKINQPVQVPPHAALAELEDDLVIPPDLPEIEEEPEPEPGPEPIRAREFRVF